MKSALFTRTRTTCKDGQLLQCCHSEDIMFNSLSVLPGFPGGSAVKITPAMQETWVQSLGQEDPLEKKMATLSSMLAWETP